MPLKLPNDSLNHQFVSRYLEVFGRSLEQVSYCDTDLVCLLRGGLRIVVVVWEFLIDFLLDDGLYLGGEEPASSPSSTFRFLSARVRRSALFRLCAYCTLSLCVDY